MSRTAILRNLVHDAPVIAPSVLKVDYGNLHREVQLLEQAGVGVLHLDVMDAHFVPNLSYGPAVIESWRKLTELPFDAHLMISEPGRYLDDYLSAGCDAITIHRGRSGTAGDLARYPEGRPIGGHRLESWHAGGTYSPGAGFV